MQWLVYKTWYEAQFLVPTDFKIRELQKIMKRYVIRSFLKQEKKCIIMRRKNHIPSSFCMEIWWRSTL